MNHLRHAPLSGRTRANAQLQRKTPANRHANGGYILMECILALTVFAWAVVGLAHSLGVGIEQAGRLSRENDIRIGMRSFLEEVRRKPLSDMNTAYQDARLGVTFNSTVDQATIRDKNGTILADLYNLHVTVTDDLASEPLDQVADVLVYEPQGQGMSQQQAATAADGTAKVNQSTGQVSGSSAPATTSSPSTSGSGSTSPSTTGG